jgi:hypothetical protein
MNGSAKTESGSARLEFVKGNVFDAKSFGADGLVVFYYGLSGIRAEAGTHERDERFNAAFRFTRYMDIGNTAVDKVENTDDMRARLFCVLDEAAAGKCRILAMNGMKAGTRPDAHVRPEKYQIGFVKEWLDRHPGVFDKICLIDQRGGFNQADDMM